MCHTNRIKMTFIVFSWTEFLSYSQMYTLLYKTFTVLSINFILLYTDNRNRSIQKTYSVFVETNNCSLHSSFNGQTTIVGSTMFPNSGCFVHKINNHFMIFQIVKNCCWLLYWLNGKILCSIVFHMYIASYLKKERFAL